jgi:hypothetical protein
MLREGWAYGVRGRAGEGAGIDPPDLSSPHLVRILTNHYFSDINQLKSARGTALRQHSRIDLFIA